MINLVILFCVRERIFKYGHGHKRDKNNGNRNMTIVLKDQAGYGKFSNQDHPLCKLPNELWPAIIKGNLEGKDIIRISEACKELQKLYDLFLFNLAEQNNSDFMKNFWKNGLKPLAIQLSNHEFSGKLSIGLFPNGIFIAGKKTLHTFNHEINETITTSIPSPKVYNNKKPSMPSRQKLKLGNFFKPRVRTIENPETPFSNLSFEKIDPTKILLHIKDNFNNTTAFKIWDVNSNTCMWEKADVQNNFVMHNQGKIIYHSAESNQLEVWDITKAIPKKEKGIDSPPSRKITSIHFAEDHLLILCDNHSILCYDLSKGELAYPPNNFYVPIPFSSIEVAKYVGVSNLKLDLKLVGKDKVAYIIHGNGEINIRNLKTNTFVTNLYIEAFKNENDCYPFDATEKFCAHLFTLNGKTKIYISRTENCKSFQCFEFIDKKIEQFKITNSSLVVMYTEKEKKFLEFWNFSEKTLIKSIPLENESYQLKQASDKLFFVEVTKKDSRSILCFDLQTGECLTTIQPPPNSYGTQIQLDGDRLFLAPFINSAQGEKNSQSPLYVYDFSEFVSKSNRIENVKH